MCCDSVGFLIVNMLFELLAEINSISTSCKVYVDLPTTLNDCSILFHSDY